jgi:O-antigen ligase
MNGAAQRESKPMSHAEHILGRAALWPDEVAKQSSSTAEVARSVNATIRVLRPALVAVALLLPLAVLPGLEHPFSRPKLVLWAAVVLCGILICPRQIALTWSHLPASLQIALSVWLGALGVSALWGQFASLGSLLLLLTGVVWCFLLLAARPHVEHLSWVLVISGSVIAAVALAQFLDADPFSALGWISASSGNSRMRVFATLGNPDFVAAFLSGLLPLTICLTSELREQRWLLMGLSALQAAAILATGSRASILALGGALLWMMHLRGRRLACVLSLTALCIVALAASTHPARSLSTTLRGRSYIWKVTAAHLREHLLLGLGPGGFGASFPAWEAQYWRGIPDDRDRQFAGVEDHAHNDYLEIFADHGAVGLLGFVAVLLAFLRIAASRSKNPLLTGASAGVVALAATALVDFPMMRPAEAFLLWSLMAISLLSCFHNVRKPASWSE